MRGERSVGGQKYTAMGDWDDEDFEVPVLTNSTANLSVSNGDEEEDEALKEAAPVVAVKAAGVIKKAQEEQEILANKMEHAMHENETRDEKRLREKRQAEEADVQLAGDLFQGSRAASEGPQQTVSAVKSVASIPLKTKEDHSKLGTLLSKRLATSSAFNVAALYKALTPALNQGTITCEVLDEILRDIKAIRDAKAIAEKPVKAAVVKKSKKEIEAEQKKHAAVFGGSEDSGKYDHFSTLEDDFM